MEFKIIGDFNTAPALSMDGVEIKYKDLNVSVWPEMELENDDGSLVKYPASARLVFSVSENIGNLKVDKYYQVKASESTEGKLIVTEVDLADAKTQMTPKMKMKKCPDCGKPMKDCTCDDTEEDKTDGSKLVKKGYIGYSIYMRPPEPGTRAYKEEVMREVAEGLNDVQK